MAPNETFMLDKSKSTHRIDPLAALINAHCRAAVIEEKTIVASVRDFEILAKHRNTPRFITVKAEMDDPPAPTPLIDPVEPDTTEDVAKAKAI